MIALFRNRAILLTLVGSVLICLTLSEPSSATGPRVTPRLLSPEKDVIFTLEMPPFATTEIPGGGLFSELVLAALEAEGVKAVVVTQPLTRLVRYHVLHNACLAAVEEGWSFSQVDRKRLIVIPFYVVSGGFFKHEPVAKTPQVLNVASSGLKSHIYGVRGEEYLYGDGTMTYHRLLSLFKKLKEGDLDFISAPVMVGKWIMETRFPNDRDGFVVKDLLAWESPASIVFSKEHPQGESTARKFMNGLSTILQNGTYEGILEKFYGKGQIPAEFRTRLEH